MHEVAKPASTFHRFIHSRPTVTVSPWFVLYPLPWMVLFWMIVPLNLPHCGWKNLLPIIPMALFSALCHELGHAFWAVRLGNEWLKLNFEARRLSIVRSKTNRRKNWQIILAGPLAGIFVGLLYGVAGWALLSAHHSSTAVTFIAATVYVIAESFFNLLPVGHSDGAHLAQEIRTRIAELWNRRKRTTSTPQTAQWDFTD